VDFREMHEAARDVRARYAVVATMRSLSAHLAEEAEDSEG